MDESDDYEVRVTNDNDKKENKVDQETSKEIVFLIDNGKAKKVDVKTGIQDNDFIEIKSGLKPGDKVICGPYSAVSKILKDKSKVKVVKKEDLYKNEK